MACNTIKLGDGTVITACGPRRKMKSCSYCTRPHTRLCDFKMAIEGGWKICSARLCRACADTRDVIESTGMVRSTIDHCSIHRIRGDKEVA